MRAGAARPDVGHCPGTPAHAEPRHPGPATGRGASRQRLIVHRSFRLPAGYFLNVSRGWQVRYEVHRLA